MEFVMGDFCSIPDPFIDLSAPPPSGIITRLDHHRAVTQLKCCTGDLLIYISELLLELWILLQVLEMQQKKCSVIFDLSCNLARVLEFCTCEIPQAFLSGPGINLQRLTELIIFILNHVMMAGDSEFFDLSYRRQGQSAEKMNRGMILAPLVGIILNLLDASAHKKQEQNDLVEVLASMDCPATVHCGLKYLLDYNWNGVLRVGDASVVRLGQLEKFLGCLRSRTLAAEARESGNSTEEEESYCCICYACKPDTRFKPCQHISCYSCITRHLLNSRRCFFCNATVIEVVRINDKECGASNLLGG